MDVSFELDPSGHAPLSGELVVDSDEPVSVELRVPGDHGPDSDVGFVTPAPSTHHVLPVLGLYPDRSQGWWSSCGTPTGGGSRSVGWR